MNNSKRQTMNQISHRNSSQAQVELHLREATYGDLRNSLGLLNIRFQILAFSSSLSSPVKIYY